MTDILCGYPGDRDAAIIAFLYEETDPGERSEFQAHLLTCSTCRDDVASLRGVRAQLARWQPPGAISNQPFTIETVRKPHWWRDIPAWAQVAAALLFLGVSAGVANLDVRYDQNGLSIRTGWSARPTRVTGSSLSATTEKPWRVDLAALEQQLKTEFHAEQASSVATSASAVPARAASASDADTIRRVRALLEESEKRQQRELALRVAEVLRDVNRQRQADLVNIDRNLNLMQNKFGVEALQQRQEVLQQRQSLNYFMRVNQRQ